jgi:hypothetical protein
VDRGHDRRPCGCARGERPLAADRAGGRARALFLAIGIAGFALAGAFLAYPRGYAMPLILVIEAGPTLSIAVALALLAGVAAKETATTNPATLAGLCGAALVGPGLFGFVTHPHLLRKILAFNLPGSGVFLLFASFAAHWQIIAPPRTLDSVVQKPVADLGVCSLLPQASGLLYD